MQDLSPPLQALTHLFEQHAHAEQARQMRAYLKDKFDMYGIKTPLRRQLSKEFIQLWRKANERIPTSLLLQLWAMPQREYQYVALDLLDKYKRSSRPEDLQLFETLILDKSWWDTVDALASHQVGWLFLRHGELIDAATAKWMDSGNMWLQRTCLLYQLGYKNQTNWPRLQSYILALASSREFFLRKAIGWALRQYAKTDPEAVKAFVHTHSHSLAPLSIREALKGLKA